MAKVSLRNLNDLHRKDSNLGQTLDDVVSHLSNHKTDIETLKKLVDELRKKVGI